MPRYDYRCRDCDGSFEIRRSFADDGEVLCPEGHRATTRVFTPVAVGRGSASSGGAAAAASAPAATGGGCCGGGCCG